MDERKAAILRAVVEEYIDTAQPVGSGHVARRPGVQVSPATVRNEMVALEQEGYLVQPHTSAGRIPTDQGYRFFVDHMTSPGPLGQAEQQQVRRFFDRAHGALEEMLRDTTRLLSGLTDYTAVVVGPAHEDATVRSVQLVGLGPRTALAVAVLSNGVVEKATVELPDDTSDERLADATTHLAERLLGEPVGAPATTGDPSGDAAVDDICSAAVRALKEGHATEPEQVFVGGTARMAAAFDAVETVREVLAILEQQFVVVGLLRDVLDRGLSVAICAETGVQPLAECSVVVSPYTVDGEPAGTIAVLGPTRMHYPQALAAVGVVSQRLGRRLQTG